MRASPLMYNELIFVMVLFFLVASRVFTDKLAINSEFLSELARFASDEYVV